ncbi:MULTISPECIES: hypothetical protein [unclassified Streptomyces]|uniref:hypothetical protein n=1 Tax=unclassified Streptomyces TaxID=2593676 RepID=UPI0004C535CB|nr:MULTISPECIES: hypothetical protein [unclassified Streptomyces]
MAETVGTVNLGTFDAESRWRPDDLAQLPAVADVQSRAQVATMDEMLLGFCEPGDALVTRYPVAAPLREAFAGAGFAPRYLSVVDEDEWLSSEAPRGATVERLLLGAPRALREISRYPGFVPYAVLPDTVELAARTGHGHSVPDVAAVARANSKVFSDDLAHRLGLPAGRTVRSVAELSAAVAETDGTAVIKDPFGVGGRGILEVDRPAVLRTITRYLGRQVGDGRRVELVVQPKWPKRADFSGYLDITRAGGVEFLGTQSVEHRGLSHVGVGPLSGELADEADRQGFSRTLVRLGAAIAAEGYWGPVGVDSLLLGDGRIVPVLEINARRSIGMLNMAIDRRVRGTGLRSHLWRVSLVVRHEDAIGRLLDELAAAGALHSEASPGGVLPLTGSVLRPPRGRLECAFICLPSEVETWRQRLTRAAEAVGMRPVGAPAGAR